jgi:DNA-binding SARP family transcriptional activator
MALSVLQLAALSARLPAHPLFSHLPGFAIFGVGMLAGALAVIVSGWLRDHAVRASTLTQFMLTGPVIAAPGRPARRSARGLPVGRPTGRATRIGPEPPLRAPRLAVVPQPAVTEPARDAQPGSGLRIGLLGALTVNDQAGALVPAQSQLIVALALNQQGLPNRRLRTLLGADAAHPKPPDSLRQLIARTRRALGRAPDGREWIEHLGHGLYALHPSAQVDWREFDKLTAEGLAGSDPARLTRALKMVRGQPFTECYYWWLEPELTESVSARIVAAAGMLAELNLAAGDPAAAVRAARIGLSADPSAEQLWRAMMRAEHAAGNLAGVREAMSRCLTVVAEVAADGQPDSATLAVYGRLLAR